MTGLDRDASPSRQKVVEVKCSLMAHPVDNLCGRIWGIGTDRIDK